MKLGISGTGQIVRDFLPAMHELGLEKVYILGTERSRANTEALVNDYRLDGCCFDYDELLASDIDTVYIALPNFLHYKFAKQALLADKHVIIEKPATVNHTEFCDLMETARAKGKFMFEAMTIHYTPAYISLREELPKLGAVRMVSMNYSQYSSRYDAFRNGEVLPAFDPKKAGGALMDINVYNIHFVVGLFGKPLDAKYYPNIQRGIDTSGVMVLDYGTFKAVCIGAKDCAASVTSSIQGEEACISINAPANQFRGYTLKPHKAPEEVRHFDRDTHRMLYEFREFMRIVEENDRASADEGLRVSEIVSELTETTRKQEEICFGDER